MPFKNFRLNRIQNGRLSATIYFHIADIWYTVLDSWTITIKHKSTLDNSPPPNYDKESKDECHHVNNNPRYKWYVK